MSQSSRNAIWEYFTKCETDISKAKCLECSKLLSLSSDKPGKQTVHGLKMHLEKCHKEVFSDYMAKVNAKAVIQELPAKKAKLDVPGASQPNIVQLSLPEAQERSMKWPDDHPAVKRIEKAIMDLIVVDMLPYSIVEGDAFKHLNFVDPAAAHRFEPKTEKYFRTTIMPATYDKVASRIHNLLSKVDFVSFTTDGWSNASKSCSLLSFTAHFLHQSTCVRR